MDLMTTHDISCRFTASQALKFLESFASKLRLEQLQFPVPPWKEFLKINLEAGLPWNTKSGRIPQSTVQDLEKHCSFLCCPLHRVRFCLVYQLQIMNPGCSQKRSDGGRKTRNRSLDHPSDLVQNI
ncbi:hypothetical protein JB92DRAFT_3031520 [Gautieria morchelliformis]|nr:hypothetical protein JB92DRAFT_3031520 [Gautieria morchelliformis]